LPLSRAGSNHRRTRVTSGKRQQNQQSQQQHEQQHQQQQYQQHQQQQQHQSQRQSQRLGIGDVSIIAENGYAFDEVDDEDIQQLIKTYEIIAIILFYRCVNDNDSNANTSGSGTSGSASSGSGGGSSSSSASSSGGGGSVADNDDSAMSSLDFLCTAQEKVTVVRMSSLDTIGSTSDKMAAAGGTY
jgi:hypothetical protein